MTQLPPEITAALSQLRAAGECRDWDTGRAALGDVLVYTPIDEVITWLLGPLAAYVPRFEQYHPDEGWPRRRIKALRDVAPDFSAIVAPPWLPEAGHTYDTPGSMYFVQALEQLWRAMIVKTAPVPYLVETITAINMADLVEWWFCARPDEWRLWRSAVQLALDMDDAPMMVGSADQKRAVAVMLRFFDHPATARRDRAAWLAVAAALERLLRA